VIAALTLVACWLAPAIGARRWRAMDPAERAVWWWLLLGAVLNTLLYATTLRGIRNAPLAWATFPLYGFVGLRGLLTLEPRPRVRTVSWAGFALYCVLWLVTGVPRNDFSSYAGPLLWVLLCSLATVILVRRMGETRTPLHDVGTLIAIGLLITYLPIIALEPLGTMIYAESPQLFTRLWHGRIVLAIAGSLIFAWAYLPHPGRA